MATKELTPEEIKLYNELRLLVKKANQRLVRLERNFGANSWASKQLKASLDSEPVQAWTVSGRIKLNKSMDLAQLKAVQKATEKFIKSKTSTVKGVKQTIKKTKKSIAKNLKQKGYYTDEDIEDVENMSDEDAETFYSILADEGMKFLLSVIPASELFALIEDAKEQNDTEEDFISRIEDYITVGNDADLREKLIAVYNKYIAK